MILWVAFAHPVIKTAIVNYQNKYLQLILLSVEWYILLPDNWH